jgi:hypothetical protein
MPSGQHNHKESSPEMSALASEILRMPEPVNTTDKVCNHCYRTLLEKAKRLAGSVLSQDEDSASG